MAAEAAKALGIKVYTIGAGVRGEAPMPVKDEFGNTHIVMVKSDVDEDTLSKIADETGGKFFRATDTDSLKHIYAEIDRHGKDHAHASRNSSTSPSFSRGRCCPGCSSSAPASGLEQTRFRRLP